MSHDPADRPHHDRRFDAALAAWCGPDDCPDPASAVVARWRAERARVENNRIERAVPPRPISRRRALTAAAVASAAAVIVGTLWFRPTPDDGPGPVVAEAVPVAPRPIAPDVEVGRTAPPAPDRLVETVPPADAAAPIEPTLVASAEPASPVSDYAAAWLDRQSGRLTKALDVVLDPPRPDPWETLRWGVEPYRTGLSDAVHFVNDALPGEPRSL